MRRLKDLCPPPETLTAVFAVLATPGHPGHYCGCRAADVGTHYFRPWRDVRAAREQLRRLLDEALCSGTRRPTTTAAL